MARRPSFSSALTTSPAGPALAWKLTATSAPSAPKASAIARPKPRPAPVTRATRPSRRPLIDLAVGPHMAPRLVERRGLRHAPARSPRRRQPPRREPIPWRASTSRQDFSSLGQVVLSDLDRPRDPDVALAQDQLEEPGYHPHARRPSDDLGMAHEVEEAALLPRAFELFLPHVEDVFLAPDPVADGRDGAEAEERPVVVAPRRRQLHQLAMRRRVAIRQIAVHEVRVIDEAVLLEQAHRVFRGIGRRHARAQRADVEDLLEDVERLHQQLLFFFGAPLQEEWLLVQVAVLAHLVTAAHDLAAEIGIALDDPAGNEPTGLDAVAIQDVEDAWRARFRAVGAHRHVQRPLGERGVAMDPRALAVEIERDGERAPLPLRPPDLPLHADLPSAVPHSNAGQTRPHVERSRDGSSPPHEPLDVASAWQRRLGASPRAGQRRGGVGEG